MNQTRILRPFLFLAACFTLCLAAVFFASTASGQTADQSAAIGTAALETAGTVAQPFIVGFAAKYPWLVTVLAVVATLRLVFKPIMSAAAVYVKSTASPDDDALLERVEHSRAFKVAAWLLDYLGSIKVGPQLAPVQPAPKPQPAAE